MCGCISFLYSRYGCPTFRLSVPLSTDLLGLVNNAAVKPAQVSIQDPAFTPVGCILGSGIVRSYSGPHFFKIISVCCNVLFLLAEPLKIFI